MATTQRDYYEVLGVPRDADQKKIKGAFRRLARKYHPDRSTEPGTEARFREITEAYGVLSDPAKRAAYDRHGFAGVTGITPEDVWSGIDFADLFGAGGPAFSDGLFERLFGRAARPGPPRGADLEAMLTIPLRRVLTGGRETVTIARPGPCPDCSGSGALAGTAPRSCPACAGSGQRTTASRRGNVVIQQVSTCPDCGGSGTIIDQPCPACQGTGQAVRQDRVTVHIPAGIPDGTTLRIAGHGMPAPALGGEPGDAYVTIRAEADPRLARRGSDLWCELEVPVPDAVLGTTATVAGLEGDVTVTVPPGTQPGTTIPIAGQGLPHHRAPGRGSLNVVIAVRLPQTLTQRQRQLYQQLREQDTHADDEATAAAQP